MMTDIVERLRELHGGAFEVSLKQEAADEIERLRGTRNTVEAAEEITQLREENFALSAWQCVFHDGKTGLVCGEHGNQYCAMQQRAEKAGAEIERLNTQIECDTETIAGKQDEIARLREALDGQTRQAGKFFAENCRLEGEIERLRGICEMLGIDKLDARNDALEEAAKVAEEYADEVDGNPIIRAEYIAARVIAKSIRALEEKAE